MAYQKLDLPSQFPSNNNPYATHASIERLMAWKLTYNKSYHRRNVKEKFWRKKIRNQNNWFSWNKLLAQFLNICCPLLSNDQDAF